MARETPSSLEYPTKKSRGRGARTQRPNQHDRRGKNQHIQEVNL